MKWKNYIDNKFTWKMILIMSPRENDINDINNDLGWKWYYVLSKYRSLHTNKYKQVSTKINFFVLLFLVYVIYFFFVFFFYIKWLVIVCVGCGAARYHIYGIFNNTFQPLFDILINCVNFLSRIDYKYK